MISLGQKVQDLLLVPVMELREHVLQFFRDRQAQIGGILQQAQALVSFLMVNFCYLKRMECCLNNIHPFRLVV